MASKFFPEAYRVVQIGKVSDTCFLYEEKEITEATAAKSLLLLKKSLHRSNWNKVSVMKLLQQSHYNKAIARKPLRQRQCYKTVAIK